MPHAEVSWLKDGQSIDKTTSNVLINQKHSRHSLTLLNIDERSVGQYQCKATNNMGEDTKFVKITGFAKEAIILSPSESVSQTSYILEWTAQSKSPISQFEVSVRKAGDTEWKVHEVNIDIPDVSESEDTLGDWSLELTGLEPSTLYQAAVASRNRFGLSDKGHVFTFATKAADPVQQPMVTKSSSSSSSSIARVSLCLILTVILSLL
eukprot:TRINITY_DN14733_c0_g1_i1.p1 TRINITY_DN14733_c0_g1~~TRINITY_DN14733_c0_g1_i1.p1  ORF type:complete len:241 (+),score=67.28 TRINITY_DN14733_c0_g1_i1:101-724(+)